MGLFQQFPFTNFHELNLDWLIKAVKDLGEHAVLSVNGETGDVVLYKSENIVFPEVTADTWRMVRVAGGRAAGVMFQNGLLYVMYDNTADRVYTINHPPAFPVTSVNGQTGAVETYADAYNQLQPVAEQNTNFYRIVDKDGSPVSVGVQVDKNKIERMHGTSRYKVYDEGNTPNLVTSINGESGTVMIAIPFADVETENVMFQDAAAAHAWSLGRETLDGVASIQLETSANGAEVYLRFYTEDDPPVSYVRKLLTMDDIPSSSGVVSLNGLTGVVTLYGNTMPIESGETKTVVELIREVEADIAYVETGATATHNIVHGSLVIWQDDLYTAISNISIGDALSLSVLSPVTEGGLNALNHLYTATPVADTNIITPSSISDRNVIYKEGCNCKMCIDFTVKSSEIPGFTKLFDIPAGYRVENHMKVIGLNPMDITDTSVEPGYFQFDDNTLTHIRFSRQLKAGHRYLALLDWIAN